MDRGMETDQIPEPTYSRAIQELKRLTESYERDRAERERSDTAKRDREDRALLPDDYGVRLDLLA